MQIHYSYQYSSAAGSIKREQINRSRSIYRSPGKYGVAQRREYIECAKYAPASTYATRAPSMQANRRHQPLAADSSLGWGLVLATHGAVARAQSPSHGIRTSPPTAS